MDIKRDELFQFMRWLNLLVGIFNLYLYSLGGGYHLLGLGLINTAIWSFTRKVKIK